MTGMGKEVPSLPIDKPEVRTIEFDLPRHRWRVMFHDGGLVDVLTRCTDSRLNDFAFQAYYGKKSNGKGDGPERIVGFTDLGEAE